MYYLTLSTPETTVEVVAITESMNLATTVLAERNVRPAVQLLLFASSTCKCGASRSTSLLKEILSCGKAAVISPVS
jgi:hypothetical protein